MQQSTAYCGIISATVRMHACSGFAKPMRVVAMPRCWTASMMASFAMSTPCAEAASAARLAASFTAAGAGCHSGGPCESVYENRLC